MAITASLRSRFRSFQATNIPCSVRRIGIQRNYLRGNHRQLHSAPNKYSGENGSELRQLLTLAGFGLMVGVLAGTVKTAPGIYQAESLEQPKPSNHGPRDLSFILSSLIQFTSTGPNAIASVRPFFGENKKVHESSFAKCSLPGDPVALRVDTAQVRCNDPCEDAIGCGYAYRGNVADAGFSVWGVFDGHINSGPKLSHLLSLRIPNQLIYQLPASRSRLASDSYMEAWFKRLFEGCEFEIMQTAFTALGQPRPGTKEKQAVELATSGSCAIVGMYDHASSKLRVACTGDSRAVLGTRNEAGKGWIAVAMSEDQTGFNKAEIDRVNAEHPGESPISPETGRTLGIAVTRAFGDHLWKWPIDMIKIAAERFDGWKPRPEYHTPPYLTVRPEIKHRTVKDQDFLILASDGFWDHVSNEDAVALVRAWIDARPKKDWISRISMPETAETSETTEQEPLMDTPWRWRFQQKYTTVRDDNAAVHLIRNAFGGNQTAHFEVIMTPDAPQARSFRDDTSVIVVFFDNTTRDTRTYEPVSDEPYWNYYRPAEYFRFPRTLTEDPQVQKVNSK